MAGMSGKDPGSAGAGANAPPSPGTDQHALAPMDFSTFVMSLGSSAMIHLGKIPSPDGPPKPREGERKGDVDLAAAKQIIDILGVLEEKTQGNLDDSEQRLLQTLLYDLRVEYVDAQKEAQGQGLEG